MNNSIMESLETYISSKILKQPGNKIAPEEALISSGLVELFQPG